MFSFNSLKKLFHYLLVSIFSLKVTLITFGIFIFWIVSSSSIFQITNCVLNFVKNSVKPLHCVLFFFFPEWFPFLEIFFLSNLRLIKDEFSGLFWPMECIGSDILGFPRLEHKKFWSFYLAFWNACYGDTALMKPPLGSPAMVLQKNKPRGEWVGTRPVIKSSSWAPSRQQAATCLLVSVQMS